MKQIANAGPSRLLYALLLLAVLLLNSGCEDPLEQGSSAFSGTTFLAVAGDATLRLYDLDAQSWVSSSWGLGLGPNWIVSSRDYNANLDLYVISSLSAELHHFRAPPPSENPRAVQYMGSGEIGRAENRNPWAGALTGDGRMLVSNWLSNNVSVIDLATLAVDTLWPAGLAPEGLLVQGDTAWVINSGYDITRLEFGQGSLYAYDLASGELLDTTALGVNPQFGIVGREGRLHIACTGDYGASPGEAWILDRESLELHSRIELAGYPGRLTRTRNDTVCLAAGGWSSDGRERGLVLRYEASTGSVLPPLEPGMGVVDIAWVGLNDLWTVSREAMRLEKFVGDEKQVSLRLNDPPNALAYWEARIPVLAP